MATGGIGSFNQEDYSILNKGLQNRGLSVGNQHTTFFPMNNGSVGNKTTSRMNNEIRLAGAPPSQNSGVPPELQQKLDDAKQAVTDATPKVTSTKSEYDKADAAYNEATQALTNLKEPEKTGDESKDAKALEDYNKQKTDLEQKQKDAEAAKTAAEKEYSLAQEELNEAQNAQNLAQAEVDQANDNNNVSEFNQEDADVLDSQEYEEESARLSQEITDNGDGSYNNINTMKSLTGKSDFSQLSEEDKADLKNKGLTEQDISRLQSGQFITGSKEEVMAKLTALAPKGDDGQIDAATQSKIYKYANSSDANNKLYALNHNQATNPFKHKDGTWKLNDGTANQIGKAQQNLKIHARQLAALDKTSPDYETKKAQIEEAIKKTTDFLTSQQTGISQDKVQGYREEKEATSSVQSDASVKDGGSTGSVDGGGSASGESSTNEPEFTTDSYINRFNAVQNARVEKDAEGNNVVIVDVANLDDKGSDNGRSIRDMVATQYPGASVMTKAEFERQKDDNSGSVDGESSTEPGANVDTN